LWNAFLPNGYVARLALKKERLARRQSPAVLFLKREASSVS
jgi:hypothetical protein